MSSPHHPSFQPPATGGQSGPWGQQQYAPGPTAAPPTPPPTHPPAPPRAYEQRPAVLAAAATMGFMASLQFLCVLGFVWLVAWTGVQTYDPSATTGEGALFTLASRAHNALKYGLALPLFAIPVIALITSWFALLRQPWGRLAYVATGLLALGWSGWWLRDRLEWWIAPAVYIGVCCLLVWTPGVNRWLAQRPR